MKLTGIDKFKRLQFNGFSDLVSNIGDRASDEKMLAAYSLTFKDNIKMLSDNSYFVSLERVYGDDLKRVLHEDSKLKLGEDYHNYCELKYVLNGYDYSMPIRIPFIDPQGQSILNDKRRAVMPIVEDIILTRTKYSIMFKLSRTKFTVTKESYNLLVNGVVTSKDMLLTPSIFNRTLLKRNQNGDFRHPLGMFDIAINGLFEMEGDSLSPFKHHGAFSSNVKIIHKDEAKPIKGYTEYSLYEQNPRRSYIYTKTGFLNYKVYVKDLSDDAMSDEILSHARDTTNAIALINMASVDGEPVNDMIESELDKYDGREMLESVLADIGVSDSMGSVTKDIDDMLVEFTRGFDNRTTREFMSAGMNISTYNEFFAWISANFKATISRDPSIVGMRVSPMYTITMGYFSLVNKKFRSFVTSNKGPQSKDRSDMLAARITRDIGNGRPLSAQDANRLLAMEMFSTVADTNIRALLAIGFQDNGDGILKRRGNKKGPLPPILSSWDKDNMRAVTILALKKKDEIPVCMSCFIDVNSDGMIEEIPYDKEYPFLNEFKENTNF